MEENINLSRKRLLSNIITGSLATVLLLIFSLVDINNELGIFKRETTSEQLNKIILWVLFSLSVVFLLTLIYSIIRYCLKKIDQVKIDKTTEFLNTMNIIPIILMLFICMDAFFFSPVQVSGKSMENSLHDKDLLITAHYSNSYDIGDIVIIKKAESDELIIKRVVAKGGDTLSVTIEGVVTVNGTVIEDSSRYYSSVISIPERVLEEGEYYCLGDNRDISLDSRHYGVFNTDHICGKVAFSLSPLKFKIETELK